MAACWTIPEWSKNFNHTYNQSWRHKTQHLGTFSYSFSIWP